MKTIFLGLVGSRGYGVESPDSDHDYLGVAIESEDAILGLGHFEQHKTKSPDGDSTIYGLRKFLGLVLKGGPHATELLWCKNLEADNRYAQELIELRPKLVSKRLLRSYSGYLTSQIERLQGVRGQKDIKRPDLVEKFGYDTKYAYHIIRLGLMAQVFGQTGRLYMPLDDIHRQILRDVREGRWPIERVYQLASTHQDGITHYLRYADIPDAPDFYAVEQWLISVYRREYLK